MLGSRILPAGIGHTTSCFVQIEGTPENKGYLQQESTSTDEEPSKNEVHSVHFISPFLFSVLKFVVIIASAHRIRQPASAFSKLSKTCVRRAYLSLLAKR